jgi:hypothetical protein
MAGGAQSRALVTRHLAMLSVAPTVGACTLARRAASLSYLLAALPPLRPAAAFCGFVPPWPLARRLVPLPELSPPRFDEPGLLAILAARSLLMRFFRRPSYWLSFFSASLYLDSCERQRTSGGADNSTFV